MRVAAIRIRAGEIEPHQSQLVIGYFRHVKQWYIGEKTPEFLRRKWKCRVLFTDYKKARCLAEATRIWKTNPLRYHFS